MNKQELLDYLEQNSSAIDTFREKGLEYQNMKNQKRQPAKRWNETKVDRAVDKMVQEFIESIHQKMIFNIKSDSYESWQQFIEQNEVVEGLEESVNEMEFE
ncbi:hypothetical protein ACPBEH_11105 [Latilactobacillus sp. 5-91]|uniref:hypothetical protein n=1 Tax=Latilactobacillus sp. 5-91 TaxID=3410924 RepID=UPI003C7118DD